MQAISLGGLSRSWRALTPLTRLLGRGSQGHAGRGGGGDGGGGSAVFVILIFTPVFGRVW